jgi:hypothetical protein
MSKSNAYFADFAGNGGNTLPLKVNVALAHCTKSSWLKEPLPLSLLR